jgi:hypothetical protein
MVKIISDVEPVSAKPDDFYLNFDLVCAIFYDDNQQLLRLNAICRQNNVKFLCGQVFGINGFMFVDLNNYSYIWFVFFCQFLELGALFTQVKKNLSTVPKVSDNENDKKPDEKKQEEKLDLQERVCQI